MIHKKDFYDKHEKMILNEELIKAAETLSKADKIALHEALNTIEPIAISGVYNACRGKRNLSPKQYDIAQQFIINHSRYEP